jgi:hypothetical protein
VCEYCLIHESDTYLGTAVDHVISEKHGGPTTEDNLAFACQPCNRAKGSDIASVIPGSAELVRLFHPRRDRWSDHFALVGFEIIGITPVGEATARILDFNSPRRLAERQASIEEGSFPSPAAAEIIRG